MGKASRKKSSVKAKAHKSNRVFTIVVILIMTVGVAGIVLTVSNDDGPSAETAGAKIGDHWHATLGVNMCGTWQGNLPPYEAATGVHSHGDGFMHIHPFSASGAGTRAKISLFYSQADEKVAADEINVGGEKRKNGDICENLDKKPGLVRWSVNGEEKTGNPGDYVPNDRDVVAIAFLPEGVEIGVPPAAASGSNPSDVAG
jgi:hypothetical protein